MDLRYLHKLLEQHELLTEKISKHLEEKTLFRQQKSKEEIKGHLAKADHNLRFVQDNIPLGYHDWCITGCYYAAYHAALALIILKGYSSKNHDATLCVLIKEFYRRGMDAEEIELLNRFFLNAQEITFYVESKNKREDAAYSTTTLFDKKTVADLRLKAVLFINKAKQIIEA